jgi:hypothetical protein
MTARTATAGCLVTLIAVCAWAVDPPGDEATNRRLLALYKSDPEKLERLRQSVDAFRALPAAEQERLRQLDRQLHELKPPTHARLRAVMERYAGWRSRLSAEDRRRLDAAPPGDERLAVVEAILDRQWQASLPRADRDRLDAADPAERARLLAQLRKADDERQRQRVAARQVVDDIAAGEMRERFRRYVDESLKPLLNDDEDARLKVILSPTRPDAGKGAKGNLLDRYVTTMNELTEGRSPLPFPGPAPPGRDKALRTPADLPADLRRQLGTPPPQAVTAAERKWPQFPLAVQAALRAKGVEPPGRVFGPTNLDELPPSVRKAVQDELLDALTEAEREQLAAAAGKWPDYPQRVMELAARHSVRIPGLALPNRDQMTSWWWRSLMGRPAEKGPPSDMGRP